MNNKTETELRIQALNLACAVMRDRIAANVAGTGNAEDIIAEADTYLEFLSGADLMTFAEHQ